MLNIIICDDEKKYVDNLKTVVEEFFKKINAGVTITSYTDGDELLNEKIKADIVFLDIEMKRVDGITVAEEIRRYDMNVPIIYVTSYVDYWRKAYSVHAFDFITKPYTKEQVEKVLSDFVHMVEETEEKKVLLKTQDCTVNIRQNDIYYFMIEKKKQVLMAAVNGNYIVKENLKDIYEKLDKDMFYFSHKSSIVNLRYVERLENGYDIIMDNGEFVPLAHNKRADFLKRLSSVILEKLKGECL